MYFSEYPVITLEATFKVHIRILEFAILFMCVVDCSDSFSLKVSAQKKLGKVCEALISFCIAMMAPRRWSIQAKKD